VNASFSIHKCPYSNIYERISIISSVSSSRAIDIIVLLLSSTKATKFMLLTLYWASPILAS
jgi:hypothetical protein